VSLGGSASSSVPIWIGGNTENTGANGHTCGAKSKEMIDSTKVKMDIDTLKKQKKAAFEEIGSMIYTMLNSGSIDEAKIKAKCDAVRRK